MQPSVAAFDRLLTQAGQDMDWSRAYACPCRDDVSGAALPSCPNCDGRGYTWGAPVRSRAAVAGMKAAKEWAAFGEWKSGDVVISIPQCTPLYEAGETDTIVFRQSSEPFSLVFRPDDARAILGAYQIDRVFWLDPVTQQPAAGTRPAIGTGGVLTWPLGGGPPAELQFSITGRRRPVYYLLKDLPQDRAHFGGLPLPRRVALRKFDLFGRT